MNSPSPEIVVAGAGQMAEEHVKTLLAAGIEPRAVLVVGRGRARADALASRYGVTAIGGGADALAAAHTAPAIVAVNEEALAPVARRMIALGSRQLLVEKPAALEPRDLAPLAEEAAAAGAAVFVGYNRRFYASVDRARELAESDGGPLAVWFEFTEVERLVLADAERRRLSAAVLGRWGAANSLHVIDLAFHLAGAPVELHASRVGELPWHPSGALFAGSGTTERGAVFAYGAAWSGAGRWSVELVTPRRKLVLRPLETLHEQLRGNFALEPVPLEEDDGLKPGLRAQLAAFLAARSGAPDPRLCTLAEARARLELAGELLGYA
jgi:predicted dehydrogenase